MKMHVSLAAGLLLGQAWAYNLFETRTTNQLRNKWEEIFSQKKLVDDENDSAKDAIKNVIDNLKAVDKIIEENFSQDTNKDTKLFAEEALLFEDENEALRFKHNVGGSCDFSLELHEKNDMVQDLLKHSSPKHKTILSTVSNHLKTKQFGAPQKQFLRVGLGNIDLLQ